MNQKNRVESLAFANIFHRQTITNVGRVRVQPEVKQEYMKFDEIIAYERRDAAQEAVRENAEKNARNLLLNGVSIDVVAASISELSRERLQQICDEVVMVTKL